MLMSPPKNKGLKGREAASELEAGAHDEIGADDIIERLEGRVEFGRLGIVLRREHELVGQVRAGGDTIVIACPPILRSYEMFALR
jgi:hypothetical protein